MIANLEPSKAKGVCTAPPSKSMAHRYLICAALSKGKSIISNIEFSEDIRATIDCIKAMGIKVETKEDNVIVEGGVSLKDLPSTTFPCRESGSTLRFFIPISMVSSNVMTFKGSKTLLSRPLSLYESIAMAQGLRIEKTEDYVKVNGPLSADTFLLKGNISSQFISGLLFTLPLLKEDSVIELIPPVDSRSYIELTLQALRKFGVNVSWQSETTLYIKGGQKYVATDVVTEGDYSNAAFLEAFNYLGGDVVVNGLDKDSLQGDRVYKELFEELKMGNPTIDISDCPDLGPVLFTIASIHNGAKFTGTKRLKIKESDRGQVMCDELHKFGVKTSMQEDSITIYKGEIVKPSETLKGHNDHRIVMSMALLLTLVGGSVDEAYAVRKSFPSFFDVIRDLGVEVRLDGVDK